LEDLADIGGSSADGQRKGRAELEIGPQLGVERRQNSPEVRASHSFSGAVLM